MAYNISEDEELHTTDPYSCTDCGACVDVYPCDAMSLNNEKVPFF